MAKPKKKSKALEIWKRFRKNKAAMIGLVLILIFAFFAIFANLICDYETLAIKQNAAIRLQPPSAEHIFGTDAYGRDLFARVVHGSRVSLSIGFISTFFSLVVGGFLGAAAGYYGGKADMLIMRGMDVLASIPQMLLALAVVAALGADLKNLIIAVTVGSIPGFTRVVKSAVLTTVGQDFIEAARACGTSDFRIICKHVIPNAIGPIIVQATMSVAKMIILAAGLSFIGMGVAAPTPEWGSMLSEGREYMRYSAYLVLFPGLAIVFSALSLDLIGDGLRDSLDPRLKN
ncbi:ABC transporter permease [Anaerotruncus rubiinfantis]|uniref:ABC transporter permease n=1 Tax=Anaerotruncus rubiinfantis TaxID=1720200 RepID=UPI0034A30CA1